MDGCVLTGGWSCLDWWIVVLLVDGCVLTDGWLCLDWWMVVFTGGRLCLELCE